MKTLIVRSQDQPIVVEFEWNDDRWGSIKEHKIKIQQNGKTKEYHFGPCARRGFRKVREFFDDQTIQENGHGFRNPHIIIYNLTRDGSGAVELEINDDNHPGIDVFSLGKLITIDLNITKEELEPVE